jgi:hypothetical protein
MLIFIPAGTAPGKGTTTTTVAGKPGTRVVISWMRWTTITPIHALVEKGRGQLGEDVGLHPHLLLLPRQPQAVAMVLGIEMEIEIEIAVPMTFTLLLQICRGRIQKEKDPRQR